ncbi:MAG: hypothetical protein OJJ21_00555 [Ferrovibrio sp.]|uniref:hypothetical protein n=1 Tax=Ferrovibrio sp. TaxID=1917215 RepID=UPI002605EC82|nr:hypothetical protein [Ferrovibrio sp.]MCW0232070.1 hypothetical protein [Ferrovibrio sp.]
MLGRLAAVILLPFMLQAMPASAMVMEVVDNQLIMSGAVVSGDYFNITSLLDRNPQVDTVVVRNSPGGHAFTGFGIGAIIRARKLNTAVSGYCRSACSRIFLGGVERRFATDTPPGQTYVAFHGNYDDSGRLNISNIETLRKYVIDYSDGKADIELVKRWTVIPNTSGYIYFFDPHRLNRKDGISVFLCQGTEKKKYEDCEKIAGKTGFDVGVYTSTELVKPNK